MTENKNFDDLLDFMNKMSTVLRQKRYKYEATWENINFIELKRKLIKSVNTLGLTSIDTPRKLIHIANYCFFLFTRLKRENINF